MIYEANAEEATNPLTPKEALLDEVNYLLKTMRLKSLKTSAFKT